MLNSTHAIAGMIGSKRASPRLSPSAMSAICCAAKAASHELKAEKMAPATAVPAASEGGGVEFSNGFEVVRVRPFGRFWREKRVMGFDGGLEIGLGVLGELVVMHLGLRMAIDDIVAAILSIGFMIWSSSSSSGF
ncbi:hypothetical protein U1Q18_029057 [Sarracenia purpurea var. burkii]